MSSDPNATAQDRRSTKKGLLLINLGTPDSTAVPDVRRYLREFLSDPRVLDINPIGRWLLLNLIILRTRPKESAEAYETVWTDRGSPLLFHGLDLRDKVSERVGPDVHVELAMRYQNPSIRAALAKFREQGIDEIVAFPLFPQYSSAASGSAIEKLYQEASPEWNTVSLQVVHEYYDHPAFIEAFRQVAKPVLEDFQPDHVMLSYHGLPERHCTKSDENKKPHCFVTPDCCARIDQGNRRCYRAQCMATSRALAAALEFTEGHWEVAFQSRLGKTPWIQPYTDERVEALAKSGVKRLAIMSPAFVADCLETLEELALRAKEDFVEHGGEDLRLVPSLNSTDRWADAVVEIARERGL